MKKDLIAAAITFVLGFAACFGIVLGFAACFGIDLLIDGGYIHSSADDVNYSIAVEDSVSCNDGMILVDSALVDEDDYAQADYQSYTKAND